MITERLQPVYGLVESSDASHWSGEGRNDTALILSTTIGIRKLVSPWYWIVCVICLQTFQFSIKEEDV